MDGWREAINWNWKSAKREQVKGTTKRPACTCPQCYAQRCRRGDTRKKAGKGPLDEFYGGISFIGLFCFGAKKGLRI